MTAPTKNREITDTDEILDRFHRGESPTEIALALDLHVSAVRFVLNSWRVGTEDEDTEAEAYAHLDPIEREAKAHGTGPDTDGDGDDEGDDEA